MSSNDWMPGAIKRPVSWAQNLTRGGTKPNKFVVHITAGSADAKATGDYFERSRVACSTFCTDKDGTIYQFQPVSARSGAEAGSRHTISNENVGTNGPLTDAQVAANARILAWLHAQHGVNLRIIATSATSENGLGSHRFGVDGNFPSTGIQRGRLQRRPIGEKWSGARGKTCPTNAAQEQLDDILALAKRTEASGSADRDDNREPVEKKNVTVDGKWGSDTTRWVQRRLAEVDLYSGTVDGRIDSQNAHWRDDNPGLTTGWEWESMGYVGSRTIRGLQALVGVKADGLIGPATIKALQRWLTKNAKYDGAIDGQLWKPSTTIKALQKVLNSKRGFDR